MQTLDQLSKRMVEIREERRDLREQDSALSAEFDELSEKTLILLDSMGCESSRTKHATLTISRQVHANVTDWDSFYQYVKEQNAFFLLQKRVSNKAWEEQRQLEPTGEVPGTEPFEKVGINVRKIS